MDHPFKAHREGKIQSDKEELEYLNKFKNFCINDPGHCWPSGLQERLDSLNGIELELKKPKPKFRKISIPFVMSVSVIITSILWIISIL